MEALFLGALAAVLTVADLSAPAIAGLMLVGWLVVALYEWAATRELPHYGRGLPPRYYVPQVSLPPPRPLEQLPAGYPAAELLDEEPTWIASPAMRDAMLAEWPVAAGAPTSPAEDTVVDELLFVAIAEEYREDVWLDVGPAEAEDAQEAEPAAVAVAEPDVVEEVEPEPAAAVVAEPEAISEPEAAVVAEPEVVVEPEPEPVAVVVAEPDVVAEPEVVEEDVEPEEAAPPREEPPGLAAERPARHTFDPLGRAVPARRRWRRGSGDEEAFAEVPARPPRPERLPGRSRREH